MIELFSGRIERYVFISSTSVYRPGDLLPIEETHPLNEGTSWEYARDKIAIERLLEATATDAFPSVSLRPAYIFGPYNNAPHAEFSLFQRIEQGRPVLVPSDGYFFFHQTHGRDLAHATIASIERSEAVGNAYNIAGRYAQSGNELVRAAAAAVGREAETVYLPGSIQRREVGALLLLANPPRAGLLDGGGAARPRLGAALRHPRGHARRLPLVPGKRLRRGAPVRLQRPRRTAGAPRRRGGKRRDLAGCRCTGPRRSTSARASGRFR